MATRVLSVPTLQAVVAGGLPPHRVGRRTEGAPVGREAVPPLRAIAATGFDAIVQFTDAVLLQALRRGIGERLSVEVGIGDLPRDAADAVRARIAVERPTAVFVRWPPARESAEVELEASRLRLVAFPRAVTVEQAPDPQLTLGFDVHISVVAVETAASYDSRVDLPSFHAAPPPFRDTVPADADPMVLTLALAIIRVDAAGPAVVHTDGERLRAGVEFDFGSASLTVGPGLWRAVVEREVGRALRELGRRRIAPEIVPFGVVGPSDSLPGVERFDVRILGLPTNLERGSLLAVCLEVAAGDAAADLTAVRPFTGAGTFAAFLAEPVVRAALLQAWKTLPERSAEFSTPITVERDGERAYGTVTRVIALGKARGCYFNYGTETLPDTVTVRADYRMRNVTASFRGEDVTGEVDTRWRASRGAFHVFTTPPALAPQDHAVERWLIGLGTHLVPPLLRPVTGWRLERGYHNQVSAALGSMLTQGGLV